MKKMSEESKAKLRYALRHPVVWWRGADLPEEKIRPWEGGVQFFAEAFKGLMGGYTSMRGRMYYGMGKDKIPPNWSSVTGIVNMTWDALNDPLIGNYLDRKRFSEKINRWIMRFNATYSPIMTLLMCFHFGWTPLQRVIIWCIWSFFNDFVSTANAVGEAKIWASITPHTEQRRIIQLCKTLGNQLSQGFSSIPILLMGLKEVIGLSDYQLMIYGAMVFAPLTVFCRWLPSFAKTRVDLSIKVKGENQTEEEAEQQPSFRESFAVVKHNKLFMMGTILGFVTLALPGTDKMFLYRFLLPQTPYMNNMQFRGKPLGGELIFFIKNFLVAVPGTFLQPFATQFIKRFGGELRFQRFCTILDLVTNTAKFIVGYNTFPKLMFMYLMEMASDIFSFRMSPVAGRVMDYQMLDYVEWKTGHRSEGMTMAVAGMINKLIRNNIGTVTGNAWLQWTQYLGWDIPVEEQPEQFLKTIWPLMHIGSIISGVIWLGAWLWFKYPHDPEEVEADLIERRALAKKLKEEAQEGANA